MKGKKPDSIAGVDRGTTNSVITLFKGGRPEAAENPEGSVITPSIVLMGKNGPIVGETAHSMAAIQADRTVREVKRMMGEDVDAYTDPDTGKGYSPVEISSFIIRHLVEYAQEYFGCEIDAVVITVPAYFKDAQREATKLAGEKAGVVVPRVINEPTAALMAYCYGKGSVMKDGIYAVLDLGGGTMDCTGECHGFGDQNRFDPRQSQAWRDRLHPPDIQPRFGPFEGRGRRGARSRRPFRCGRAFLSMGEVRGGQTPAFETRELAYQRDGQRRPGIL